MKDLVTIFLVVFLLLVFYGAGVMTGEGLLPPGVQATGGDAKEADPVVVPCKKINTLTEGEFVLSVFLCKPENATSYKINTLGFMLPENP